MRCRLVGPNPKVLATRSSLDHHLPAIISPTDNTMASLPHEILRRILHFATVVDGALDTSFDGVQNEDRNEIARAISRSMRIKRNLALVSRLFHSMMDEFLFELVRLKDPAKARPLAKLLRQDICGKPRRGWWCRRLELDFQDNGDSWPHASFTLWGLIPACPRLIYLRLHLEHLNKYYGPDGQEEESHAQAYCFRLTDILLKLIASNLANTLCRLELTGQASTLFEDFERLMSCLPHLECCRVLGVEDAALSDHVRTHHKGYNPYRPSIPVPRRTLHRCNDEQEKEEYESALRDAFWPTPEALTAGPRHPSLPRLHTLHLSDLREEAEQWHMPALAAIGAGFHTWTGTPLKRADQIRAVIGERSPTIRSLTCYGTLGDGIDVWGLSIALPNLEYLECHLADSGFESELSVPLRKLRIIKIFRNLANDTGHNLLLHEIYSYRELGFLPALERLYVTGPNRPGQAAVVLVQEFGAVGVLVESEVRVPGWAVDMLGRS